MSLPRRGLVEIETLRRYGRVPVGTRAAGTFAVHSHVYPHGGPWQFLGTRVQVADDPRVVSINTFGHFTVGGDGSRTWSAMHKFKVGPFHAIDLSDYLQQTVMNDLENEATGTGHQRFRVVRIEWRDADPPPAWVAEYLARSNVTLADGCCRGGGP